MLVAARDAFGVELCMVKTPIVVAVALATAGLGFALGRITAHAQTSDRPQDRTPTAEREPSATRPATPPRQPNATPMTRSAFTDAMQAADRDAPQAEASLPTCVQQLRVVRQLVKDDETTRTEKEGALIPMPIR